MPRASAGVRSARLNKYGPQARTLFRQMNMPEQLRQDFNFLSVITSREGFAGLIAATHPVGSEGYRLIMRGHDIAERELRHIRRHSGERAFKHAFRCALMLWVYSGVRDPDCITATFAHDLSEQFRRKWTQQRLTETFNERVARMVLAMTKPLQLPGMTKRDVERIYYEKQLVELESDVAAYIIEMKAVDLLDNLLTLWKRSAKRQFRKIDDVIRFAMPLLRRHGLKRMRDVIVLVLWEIRRKLHNGINFAH